MSTQVIQDLIEAMEAAIKAGDWKVDGACDPDSAIQRARETLAQPERTWVGLTDEEKQKIMWVFTQPNGLFKHFKYMEAVEAKLKEKNA